MVDWIERNRGFIVVTLLNLALIGGVVFWVRQPRPAPMKVIPLSPDPTMPLATATTAPLRVYITGAVMNPDVYEFPTGSIVKDAILQAGGASPDADLERVNLAQELQDQQKIYVPCKGETDHPELISEVQPSGAGKVNINVAEAEELSDLPGIGPVLAQRIVDYRTDHGPFENINSITEVSGIGDASFEKIKDCITTGD